LLAVAVDTEAAADPLPLERVFVEHQGRVFRAAYRVTGNAQDAEDVLQTVFLRLARREAGVGAVSNLPSYLYRSAVNTALDVLRSRRECVALEQVDREVRPGGDGGEGFHQAVELKAWLRGALARLSPQAAEVFALRYLEEHDNREIARMLGLSRVAVAVTLHRTRRRLQKELRSRTGEKP